MVSTRIEFAHILRGFAAGAVVASHLGYLVWNNPKVVGQLIAYPAVPIIASHAHFVPLTDFGLPYFWGHVGVALFFLISGFVIPFSASSMSRTGFAIARAFRIWPTNIFGLAIAVGCIALNSALAGNPFPYSPLQILLNALIVPRGPTLTPSIDGIIWTLEVEIFFYAVCTILMEHIRRYDRRIFLHCACIVPIAYFDELGARFLLHIGLPFYAFAYWLSTVPVYVCFMFCGTAFYFHYQRRLGIVGVFTTQLFLLLIFVTSMRVGVLAGQGWTPPISYLVAYCIFALAYFMRRRISALPYWGRRPFQSLADISYPLYVVHAVLGYTILVHAVEIGLPAWAAIAIAGAAVLCLAVAVHYAIELPSQAYGKTLAAKLGRTQALNSQTTSAPISRLNVDMTSATGPNSIIRPSRR